MRIGLAADNGNWHKARLRAALEHLGAEPVLFSLADVAVVTGAGEPLRVPGFSDGLPDGVLLRTIAGGTFEATTMRLGVLHALVASGVTVWNSPGAIERSVDKAMTSLLVARAGLPTPDTFVFSSREAAAACVAREAGPGRPLVLKPLFGSQGEGLQLIERPEDLPAEEAVSRVYYLQRYIARNDGLWRDYRVFVCEGRAIAAMIREGDGWITNVHRGGRPLPWAMPEKAAELAERAAAAIGVDYTGIDLVEDGEGGYLVLEGQFHAGLVGPAAGHRGRRRGRRSPRLPQRRTGSEAPPAPRGIGMSGLLPEAIATAYQACCLAELDALKPGNVHVFGDGHRMAVADFVTSAEISAPHLAEPGARIGRRVRTAMEATLGAVGQNTNLGILLLCAPLARAAENGGPLRAALSHALDDLDAADATDVFAAIRAANPGGLGRVERHDVTESVAPASLVAAMAEAAPRDRIARAYVTDFADIFGHRPARIGGGARQGSHAPLEHDRGLPRLPRGRPRQPCGAQARARPRRRPTRRGSGSFSLSISPRTPSPNSWHGTARGKARTSIRAPART